MEWNNAEYPYGDGVDVVPEMWFCFKVCGEGVYCLRKGMVKILWSVMCGAGGRGWGFFTGDFAPDASKDAAGDSI